MDVLEAVLPVFLVVALGAGAARYNLLEASFIERANRLVYAFFLPALLFHKIGTSDFAQAFSAPLVLGAYGATVATFLLSLLALRRRGLAPGAQGSFVQGSFRGNLAYVGLPIVLSAVGDAGLAQAGVLLGFMVPLMNALAVTALVLPHRHGGVPGRAAARRFAGELATNPLILSSLLGILWSTLRLPVPGLADRTLSLLSQATLPLSLLCLGGAFSLGRARFGLGTATVCSAAKLLVLPLLALAFYRALGVSGPDLRVGMIMMACPTAVVSYVMASQLQGDRELSGNIVVLTTAASPLTITGWLFLLRLLEW